MVAEFVKRYPSVSAGAVAYFFLGFTLPFALIGSWEKFTGDRVPDWLAKRGWTLMGAIAAWLAFTFILALVVAFVVYLIFKCWLPPLFPKTISTKPKPSRDLKILFALTGLNSERYDDSAQYLLPRFTYNTGLGFSPEIEVKANLEVWDDDSLRKKEYPGVWYDSGSRSKRFTSGDSAELVLGLVGDEGMVACEYSASTVSGVNLGSKLTELKGKKFFVRVAFIARTDKDVLSEPEQWFLVITGPEPKYVGLIKPPSHIW